MRKWTITAALLMTSVVASANAQLPAGARAVVDAYLSALQSGDSGQIRGLLDGRLQRKLSSRLDNPSYGSELVKDNADRTFTIEGHELLESGMYCVDYLGTDGNETVRKRLYLTRSGAGDSLAFRIIEEQILP